VPARQHRTRPAGRPLSQQALNPAGSWRARQRDAPGGVTIGGMPEGPQAPLTPEQREAIIVELLGRGAEAPWTPEERAAIIGELRRRFPDRHIYPIQRGNLANQWENLADSARERDADQPPTENWVPSALAPLVAAVRRTRLSRFYPFTGLVYLYFADGPGVWDEKGEVAPACIGWHQPEGYVVLQGCVYSEPWQTTCTLTTHDPDEAAAEAERLLAGWAWSGQES
jgi:hypothetical protein